MKINWAIILFLLPYIGFSKPLNRPITDEVFYFILTDRFENGDPSNDRAGIAPGDSRRSYAPWFFAIQ